MDELIGSKKVRHLLDDCSEMHIWRLLNDAHYRGLAFPPPIKINTRNFWRRREILDWIEERAAASKKAIVAPEDSSAERESTPP